MANFIQYQDKDGNIHTLSVPRAYDGLDSNSVVLPLSANQGRVLNDNINALKPRVLYGVELSRVINGTTNIPKTALPDTNPLMVYQTFVADDRGTIGVYVGDFDSATITVSTKSISPSGEQGNLLGNAREDYGGLPTVQSEVLNMWGRSAMLDDWATLFMTDGTLWEWFVVAISDDTDPVVTWGNERQLNVGDFQLASTLSQAGRVLLGGQVPGTFDDIGIDTAPTQDSGNLITSGGIFAWFGAAVSTLTTTAKTVVGAINELVTAIANRVRFDAAQTLNATQQAQVRTNIGIANIMFPNIWTANTEINFGNGLFGIRRVYNVTAGANVNHNHSFAISGGGANTMIVSAGGCWLLRNSDGIRMIFGTGLCQMGNTITTGAAFEHSSKIWISGGTMHVATCSNAARTNAPVDVWILYRKT